MSVHKTAIQELEEVVMTDELPKRLEALEKWGHKWVMQGDIAVEIPKEHVEAAGSAGMPELYRNAGRDLMEGLVNSMRNTPQMFRHRAFSNKTGDIKCELGIVVLLAKPREDAEQPPDNVVKLFEGRRVR